MTKTEALNALTLAWRAVIDARDCGKPDGGATDDYRDAYRAAHTAGATETEIAQALVNAGVDRVTDGWRMARFGSGGQAA